MKDFALVKSESGDWQGLYVDGKLKEEGHIIYTVNLVPYLKNGYNNFTIYIADPDWVEEAGNLPYDFNDAVEQGICLLEDL